jgi:hypothetical protein
LAIQANHDIAYRQLALHIGPKDGEIISNRSPVIMVI